MANSKDTGVGTDLPDEENIKLRPGDTKALKELLEKRLKDCGWRKDIKKMVRDTLEKRNGENLTHAQLAAMIAPSARAMVPENIRKEMVLRVCKALILRTPMAKDNPKVNESTQP